MNELITSLSNRDKTIQLIVLCLGFFIVITDAIIVNIALPSMAHSLSGGISWLQQVVAGYTLTFAGLLLLAGSLGDRIGAKIIYLFGLIFFTFTSLLCGLAQNFLILTIFRLFQGAAGTLLVPTSLALINSAYANKTEQARAIGIWASTGGIAAAASPVLGAILTTYFSWRAVFQ